MNILFSIFLLLLGAFTLSALPPSTCRRDKDCFINEVCINGECQMDLSNVPVRNRPSIGKPCKEIYACPVPLMCKKATCQLPDPWVCNWHTCPDGECRREVCYKN